MTTARTLWTITDRTLAGAAGAAVAIVGGVVLVGWAFGIESLKSISPSFVTMKANTALAFLLAGAALSALVWGAAGWRRHLARACALAVTAIGALTLSQYVFGWNLGIDQLLFEEPAGAAGTSHPGRMAPTTALNYGLLGAAVLLLSARRGAFMAQTLALAAAAIAWLGLLGYVFDVETFYGITSQTQMAVHTSVAFVVQSEPPFNATVLFARLVCRLTEQHQVRQSVEAARRGWPAVGSRTISQTNDARSL